MNTFVIICITYFFLELFCRYAASLKIQQPRMETVTYTVDAFRTRIMEFGQQTGCKPQHIVLFR